MKNIVRAVTDLDQAPHLHLARILILLHAFRRGSQGGPVEGLTKLAKLDFLLRYPVMLQKALEVRGRSTSDVYLEPHELMSVESQMVRYRFGPWDHRYREFLNILVAKGLAAVSVEGRKVVISITDTGSRVAGDLASSVQFESHAARSQVLKRHLDLSATNLMNFIYETFPEVVSLKYNAPIPT
ncbi:MAG: hypothetical protein EBV20_09775 [Betaproteobacteria bacterium]|nr:hypothetical protein [Betaproteobacteria bacterium]NBP45562.1 hypothetical protein [Betaproteobacteria bacterium]